MVERPGLCHRCDWGRTEHPEEEDTERIDLALLSCSFAKPDFACLSLIRSALPPKKQH